MFILPSLKTTNMRLYTLRDRLHITCGPIIMAPPIDNIQIVTNESIAIILINILWIYTNPNSFSLSLTLINRFFLFKNIVCK
jgi:hypothetical protein